MENFAANSTAPPVEGDGWPITLEELELALAAARSGRASAPAGVLRRVIRQDAGLTGFAFRVPHRRSYVIGRQRLLEIVDLDELGRCGDLLPDTVLLSSGPATRNWPSLRRAKCCCAAAGGWFEVASTRLWNSPSPKGDSRRPTFAGDRAVGRDRVRRDSQRAGQEHYLLNPDDERAVYVEFAAVYLELKCFAALAPAPSYFMALGDPAAMGRVLAQDIRRGGRVGGDPADRRRRQEHARASVTVEAEQFRVPTRLRVRAAGGAAARKDLSPDLASRKFSHYVRAGRTCGDGWQPGAFGDLPGPGRMCAPRTSASIMHARMRSDVSRLVARLQAGARFCGGTRGAVAELAVGPGAADAARLLDRGGPPAVRLAEGLSRSGAPAVHGRPDGMAFFPGTRPVKRPLPNQRDVLISKHVRSAARRLRTVRVSEAQRQELGRLLRAPPRKGPKGGFASDSARCWPRP